MQAGGMSGGIVGGGTASVMEMIAASGVMSTHDLTIGPDGMAYVLDRDFTVLTSPKTIITAISPKTPKPSEWKATIAGLGNHIAAGSDKVVISASLSVAVQPIRPIVQTPTPVPAAFKSKLYFLNSSNGSQVRAVEHDGVATSLTVVKVDSVEYVYLVTQEQVAVSILGRPFPVVTPKVKLTIYRMDTGGTVKSVDLTNDTILEQE